jgi:hypothetical protein
MYVNRGNIVRRSFLRQPRIEIRRGQGLYPTLGQKGTCGSSISETTQENRRERAPDRKWNRIKAKRALNNRRPAHSKLVSTSSPQSILQSTLFSPSKTLSNRKSRRFPDNSTSCNPLRRFKYLTTHPSAKLTVFYHARTHLITISNFPHLFLTHNPFNSADPQNNLIERLHYRHLLQSRTRLSRSLLMSRQGSCIYRLSIEIVQFDPALAYFAG